MQAGIDEWLVYICHTRQRNTSAPLWDACDSHCAPAASSAGLSGTAERLRCLGLVKLNQLGDLVLAVVAY